jgi:tetratricopeptide (TPR) repeat protein
LRSAANRRPSSQPQPFHSPTELAAELHNLVEFVHMESRKSSDNSATVNTLRQSLSILEDRIPDNQKAAWYQRGDVASAYGLVWGEVGVYAEAIDWLERAIQAEKANLSVHAMERYANFQVRHAGEQWQQLRKATGLNATQQQIEVIDQKRKELIATIEQAIGLIDFLRQRGTTSERYSLLGSAYKRLALLHEDAKDRVAALSKMAEYYRLAYELSNNADPYPFTNWSQAQAFITRGRSKKRTELQLYLRDECQQMLEVVEKRAETEPNFWNSVAKPDLEVVLLLAQSGLNASQVKAKSERIIEAYHSAFKRGASPREMASVYENLDFLIAMGDSLPKSLRDALLAIRAAI